MAKKYEITELDTEAAIEEAVAKIQERVLLAIQWLRSQQSAAELAHLVEGGAIDAIAPDVDRAAEAIATEINDAYLEAGSRVARLVGDYADTPGHFSATDSLAVQRMQANDLRLITGITQEQRNVIREVLIEGMSANLNPREIAVDLEDAIGLTPQQAQWVSSYRRGLYQGDANVLTRELRDARFDRTVRRAVDGELQLTRAQVDKMVERYRANAIALRAETIARTEAMRAVHQGMQDAIGSAIERGDLTAEATALTWWTKLDGRERDTHHDMHGQVRPYGEPYLSGSGALLEYPGDPSAPAGETINCRCTLALNFG